MDTGLAQPELVGQRELSAPALCNSVQSHTVKMRLLGGAITSVGNLARDSCMVSVSVFSQHNGKRVNHAVNFRLMCSFQTTQPLAAQGLKSLLQAIEPITKCLITRQMWKPLFPVILGELVNHFL